MAELTWADAYEQGRQAFGGQTPGANLEAQLVDWFEQHPGDVLTAIAKLGDRYSAGKIHTPWPLLLRERDTADSRHQIVADPTGDKARQVHLAERYIRNAGLYEPTAESILAGLFDHGGRLHPWQHDQPTRERMAALWRQEHLRALAADHEMRSRAARWTLTRDRDQPEPEPVYAEPEP